MFKKIILTVIIFGVSLPAFADCVFGAKAKTSYTVLDRNTVLLQGGYGNEIIVKTFCFIYSSSQITVLKDSFCSHENAVLYIDGEVCDARQVTKVN